MKGLSFNLLLLWHGLFAGSYITAFATGDELMGMHIAAGWFVIVLGAFRLLIALMVSDKSPWSLPWPNMALVKAFKRNVQKGDAAALQGRNLLIVLSGLIVLVLAVVSALSGYLTGKHLHEGIANLSLGVVLAHGGLVLLAQGLKKLKAASSPVRASGLRTDPSLA